MASKTLGQLLIEEGILTQEQLSQAEAQQASTGGKIGPALVQMGVLTEESLHYFLALQYGVDFVDLGQGEIPPEVLKSISKDLALRYQVVPFSRTNGTLTVASADPADPNLLRFQEDYRSLEPKSELAYVVSTESAVKAALARYYGGDSTSKAGGAAAELSHNSMQDIVLAGQAMDPALMGQPGGEAAAPVGEEFDENAVNDAPVIRLVNSIISQAVAKRASDIHLNPFERNMVVRYRIDGTLQPQPEPPARYRRAMVARIKVMGKMDILEKRKAQDGRIKIKVQGKVIDLRVSTLPSIYGENVVMRILDQESLQLDMNKLGFESAELAKYTDAIQQPYGMILHTGPTGSGKTTTLYSALSTLNNPAKNLMTIEDPVEYQLPGVIQTQVNPDADLTFANVLRANLRQDPNIIMLGEIRDGETAEIAIKAALTGHLVLSTLHTNDAPSTVMRLIDMGVDPIDVGSSLLIVVAQRLIKRICTQCKQPVEPQAEDLDRVMIDPKSIEGVTFYRGAGCSNCNGTGYRGRIALYEIMRVTPAVAESIFRRDDLNQLTEVALSEGMQTLRMLAINKWKAGITTMEEILRVTAAE